MRNISTIALCLNFLLVPMVAFAINFGSTSLTEAPSFTSVQPQSSPYKLTRSTYGVSPTGVSMNYIIEDDEGIIMEVQVGIRSSTGTWMYPDTGYLTLTKKPIYLIGFGVTPFQEESQRVLRNPVTYRYIFSLPFGSDDAKNNTKGAPRKNEILNYISGITQDYFIIIAAPDRISSKELRGIYSLLGSQLSSVRKLRYNEDQIAAFLERSLDPMATKKFPLLQYTDGMRKILDPLSEIISSEKLEVRDSFQYITKEGPHLLHFLLISPTYERVDIEYMIAEDAPAGGLAGYRDGYDFITQSKNPLFYSFFMPGVVTATGVLDASTGMPSTVIFARSKNGFLKVSSSSSTRLTLLEDISENILATFKVQAGSSKTNTYNKDILFQLLFTNALGGLTQSLTIPTVTPANRARKMTEIILAPTTNERKVLKVRYVYLTQRLNAQKLSQTQSNTKKRLSRMSKKELQSLISSIEQKNGRNMITEYTLHLATLMYIGEKY